MPADFSKYSNYSKENSFSSIVFGADAPLLETELNEMQQIQAERFKDYVNSIHGNIILKEGQITYENNQVTISNYTLLIDGEIVYVSNLSTSASDGDSIYIKIERTEVKYSDVLRKYGNKQEDIIENKLWDERVNQETSRRIAVTYDITTSTPSNMDKAIKMAEIIDGKLVKSYEVLNESKYNIIKTYEDVISVPNDTKGQVSVTTKGLTVTNLVQNGNFRNGTRGWTAGNSTLSADNGVLRITATDTTNSPYVSRKLFTKRRGQKLYVRVKAKVTNSECQYIRLMVGLISVYQYTPEANKEYLISGVLTMPIDDVDIWYVVYHGYENAEVATGKVMEIREAMTVDLTAMFGAGNEPTKEECDKMFSRYIDGTKSTIGAMRIKSVSEDESEVSTVYVVAKDKDGKIAELRSLPNGTKDEINVADRKLIKRIGEKSNIANGMVIDFADMAEGGTYYAWNEYGETETGIKGDILGIDATTLIYQLAEPEIIPVHVEGTLQAYKNGTIYFEPALSGKIIFAEGENTKQITTEELPIESIRKVLRYDILEDGTIREVDVTEDCTHTDTTITINNVIPNVTYFYDCDIPSEYSTSGEKIITLAENIPANVEELIDYKVKNENDKRKISANIKAIESSLSNLNNIISRDIIVISDTKPSDVAIWLEELD